MSTIILGLLLYVLLSTMLWDSYGPVILLLALPILLLSMGVSFIRAGAT